MQNSQALLLSDFGLCLFRLTQTLQKLSLREKPNSLLVQPNMAVQSLNGETPIKQVQLTSYKGKCLIFSQKNIKQHNSLNIDDIDVS